MNFVSLKSYAKINLSLRVLKKLKKIHKIETLICFINLYDEIHIKQSDHKKHEVIFNGEFSKKIPKKNTVTKLLEILDNKKLLKNKKYLIKIKKNIPQKSGLGGGSINASTILNYLIKINQFNVNLKQKYQICKKIGSDVLFGLDIKTSLLNSKNKLIKSNKKVRSNLILIKPKFGCSTKEIYRDIKFYSKSNFQNNNKNSLKISNLMRLQNDLEPIAFKQYPILINIKKKLLKLPGIKFARMTGSGSTLIGFFNNKKDALSGLRKMKKTYNNYWCILSKTI